MKYLKCIDEALVRGDITETEAGNARDVFDRAVREYGDETLATEKAVKAVKAENAIERVQRGRHLQTLKKVNNMITDHEGGAKAMIHLLNRVDNLSEAYQWEAKEIISKVATKFDTKITGKVKTKVGNLTQDDIADALFDGNTTKPEAAQMAQMIKELTDWAYERSVALGANVGYRSDFGIPVAHNASRIARVKAGAWADEMMGLLDLSKMKSPKTGEVIRPAELRRILEEDTHPTLATDGNIKAQADKAFGNNRVESRFLHFKDSRSYKLYLDKYGNNDIVTNLFGYVRQVSDEMAKLESLGPFADETVDFANAKIKRLAAENSLDRASKAGQAKTKVQKVKRSLVGDESTKADSVLTRGEELTNAIDRRWKLVRGDLNRVVNVKLDKASKGIKNIQTAALLGKTVIPASFTDFANSLSQISQRGGSARIFGKYYVKALADIVTGKNKEEMLRTGIAAMEFGEGVQAAARFDADLSNSGLTSIMANTALRASGLNAITNAGRRAAMAEISHHLGSSLDIPWSKLGDKEGEGFISALIGKRDQEVNLKFTLENEGISKVDWEKMQAIKKANKDNPDWVGYPWDFRDDPDLMRKVYVYLSVRRNFSIPTTAKGAEDLFKGQAGTIGGVTREQIGFLKKFPLTILFNNLNEIMRLPGMWNKGRNAFTYLGLLTIAGGLAVQTGNIIKGKNPVDTWTPEFLGKAMLASGGLSVFGDLIATGSNSRGQTFADLIGGPTLGLAIKTARATSKSVKQLNPTPLIEIASENIPGNNIWFWSNIYERTTDAAFVMMDPRHAEKLRRRNAWHIKNGNGYWWKPNEILPGEKPDLTGITGE